MKDIYFLFTLLSLIHFCLSLNDETKITMEVKGGIDKTSITCTGNQYIFKIPVTNVNNWDGEQSINLPIPLESPQSETVNCKLMEEESSTLKSSEDFYLSCALDTSEKKLYYSKVSFFPHYDWSEADVVITNWDTTVGSEPVVSENAICTDNYASYDFIEVESSTDQCDDVFPFYHHMYIKGKLIDNTQSMHFTSTEIELKFKMTMIVDRREVEVYCIIIEDEENSSDTKGLLQCPVKGNTSFKLKRQFVNSEDDEKTIIFIQETGDFAFQSNCTAPPSYDYEFTSITYKDDKCDTDHSDYHRISLNGKIIGVTQSMYLTSSEIDFKFKMKMLVDGEKVDDVSCTLTEDEESSSDAKGLLQCLVKGTNKFELVEQTVEAENGKKILIERTQAFEFKVKCSENSDSSDNSDDNNSSFWFKFNGLILFTLFLL